MDKPIRKAVRCYLIKDNKVVVTKFIKGLIEDRCNFKMEIQVDEKENILDVRYKLKENNRINFLP